MLYKVILPLESMNEISEYFAMTWPFFKWNTLLQKLVLFLSFKTSGKTTELLITNHNTTTRAKNTQNSSLFIPNIACSRLWDIRDGTKERERNKKENAKIRRVGSGEKGAVALFIPSSPHAFFVLVFSIQAFPTISEPGIGYP